MKKYFIFTLASIVFLLGFAGYQYFYFYDGKLHVVFCDVGQGDAILIETSDRAHILVDGGPDRSVLSCLSDHMPFWERELDLVFLTHPHADHFIGLMDVLDRYITLSFVSEKLGNKTRSFQSLSSIILEKKISKRIVFEGDRYNLGNGVFLTVEAPSRGFLGRSSPNGLIGESGEFASLILKLTYHDFDLLLTGDAQTAALSEVISKNVDSIEVIQIPHHGSRTGINKAIIEAVAPQLAVISVGKNNRYGHPNKEVLRVLNNSGVLIKRTDKEGDIEIVSDGKRWWLR